MVGRNMSKSSYQLSGVSQLKSLALLPSNVNSKSRIIRKISHGTTMKRGNTIMLGKGTVGPNIKKIIGKPLIRISDSVSQSSVDLFQSIQSNF